LKSSEKRADGSRVTFVHVDPKYKVWTERVGDGSMKMLLLHGGPGLTHEYLEVFEKFLPKKGVEFYYYDQLGSGLSDRPNDVRLWTAGRFRDEVEQVRRGLGLDDFFLFGHSWGGLLGMEYALKFQCHLKGLVISNMTASAASYNKYLNRLRRRFPLQVRRMLSEYEARGDYGAVKYQDALDEYFYDTYMCRLNPWPEALERSDKHTNSEVFDTIHGPNEFVTTGTAKHWNRWKDLQEIRVPTLLLVGRYDTMSVDDIKRMGRLVPNSRVVVCQDGSHLSMYDDQQTYFHELLEFVKDVETGKFLGRKKVT
jgi:proline iminopeptidase